MSTIVIPPATVPSAQRISILPLDGLRACQQPDTPGIYILFNARTGEIGYIGRTSSLRTRLSAASQHSALSRARGNGFWLALYEHFPNEPLRDIEERLIIKHQPPLNRLKYVGVARCLELHEPQ